MNAARVVIAAIALVAVPGASALGGLEFSEPEKIREVLSLSGGGPFLISAIDLGGEPAFVYLEDDDRAGFGRAVRFLERVGGEWVEMSVFDGSSGNAFCLDAVVVDGAPLVGVGVQEGGPFFFRFVQFFRRVASDWVLEFDLQVTTPADRDQQIAMVVGPGGVVTAFNVSDRRRMTGGIYERTAEGWTSETATLAESETIDLVSAALVAGEPRLMASSFATLRLGSRVGDAWTFEEVSDGFGKLAEWEGRPACVATPAGNGQIRFHRQDQSGAWLSESVVEGAVVRSADLGVIDGTPIVAYFNLDSDVAIPPPDGQLEIAVRSAGAWKTQSFRGPRNSWLNAIDVFSIGGEPAIVYIDQGAQSEPSAIYLLRALPGAAQFVRGDSNVDGRVDIGDAIFSVVELFRGGVSSPCPAASDTNADAFHDLSDAVFLIAYLLTGGDSPSSPFPDCGAPEAITAEECPSGSTPCP